MRFLAIATLILLQTEIYSQTGDAALNNKAVALMESEHYQEALPYLDQIVANNSGNTLFRYNRAVTLFNLKRYKDALAEYKFLAEMLPEESEYFFQVGNSYEHLDSAQLAIEFYNKAILLEKDQFLYYFKRGTIYLKDGKFKEAERDFNESLLLNPDHDNSLHNRGIALYKLGHKTRACADWCRAKELGNPYSDSHIKINCSTLVPCKSKK